MDLPLEEEKAPEVKTEEKREYQPAPVYERDCPDCGYGENDTEVKVGCHSCKRGQAFYAERAKKVLKERRRSPRNKAA